MRGKCVKTVRDWKAIAILLSAGLVIGFALSAILGIDSCKLTEAAACLNGTAENIISPGAGDKVIGAIDSAKESIHITLYEFSYSGLKEALVRAARRGVDVKLILEPKVDQNLDTADFLKGKGIQVRWASQKFNNSHAKAAIIDGRHILVGSLNWSRNAMERNREIGVLIENERMAGELEAVFELDWGEAQEVK